jgi:glycosyltransferase involved in cell wall biosynthesis
MNPLVLLFTNYGPYHIARLKATQILCQNRNWQIIPIELAITEQAYGWHRDELQEYIYTLSQDKPLEHQSSWFLIYKLWQALNHFQPQAIAIAGYDPLPMLFALIWGRLHQRPCILMSDSKADRIYFYREENKIRNRSPLKEHFKRYLVNQYAAALVAGSPHSRYLKGLGFKKNIFYGYDVVDNSIFQSNDFTSLPKPLAEPFFLVVARFLPCKNLIRTVNAYAHYLSSCDLPWRLVLCGSGLQKEKILSEIKRLGIKSHVIMTGNLKQKDLLCYYRHASAFILPSLQDSWGLVVNEAMAAGLPVLVSNRCGCFEDLVREGVNGFGFDPENQDQLTELMLKMSSGEVDLEAMGQASLDHIQKYSPDYFAQGLQQAVEFAINKKADQQT